MDAVAGAGGMFGQLAVGIAGGVPDGGGTMPGFNNAVNKLNKIGQKPTIDSLPDKVGTGGPLLMRILGPAKIGVSGISRN